MKNIDKDNDIDFVDKLVHKAYNYKAPSCPDFANIGLEIAEEKKPEGMFSSLMNILKRKTDSFKEKASALSDLSLDNICAAGKEEDHSDDEEKNSLNETIDKH